MLQSALNATCLRHHLSGTHLLIVEAPPLAPVLERLWAPTHNLCTGQVGCKAAVRNQDVLTFVYHGRITVMGRVPWTMRASKAAFVRRISWAALTHSAWRVGVGGWGQTTTEKTKFFGHHTAFAWLD